MKRLSIPFWVSLVFVGQASAMTAQQTVLKEISVVENGNIIRTEYVDASLVTPGETVVYRVDYHNDGLEPVTDFQLTMPVPSEIRFSEVTKESVRRTIVYSANNAESFHEMDDLTVELVGGGLRYAVPEDITHVRWTIQESIRPGQSGFVSFKGVLK